MSTIMKRPDFFIVGAPKCGTTAMNAYLQAHPQIFVPDRKEIHFFGTDLENASRPTEQEYLAYFQGVKDEQRVGEASVWYLYSQQAAAEIKRFSPQASIVIMLRNPVDMLHSLHNQMAFNGHEDIRSFEEALGAEPERKAGKRIPRTAGWRNVPFCRPHLYYSEVARYSEQVERYFDEFSRENVLVILFDDFRRDAAASYRQTLQFLGVDEAFQPDFKVINASKQPRSRLFQKLLLNPPRAIANAIQAVTPARLHRRLFVGLQQFNTEYVPRSPLDPQLRERLQQVFRADIDRLGQLLKRDLALWYSTEQAGSDTVGHQETDKTSISPGDRQSQPRHK